MCGIAGYIGQSKNPKITYELITCLFDFLEIRGTDASGVWGTETGNDGRILYHKEPIRATDFIQKTFWKKIKKLQLNMMLVHARATSFGGGNASDNCNNHPFVSEDKRIGMIHNGTLSEFRFLKEKYKIKSNTDSEVLLRLFEHNMDAEIEDLKVNSEISRRINGIKSIWSVISQGGMAVALGERLEHDLRYLFLFRNEKRPLWICDLRELLGQIFFFSEPFIWFKAVASSKWLTKACSGNEKLIEIPTNEIWAFWTDENNPMMTDNAQLLRFKIETSESTKEWKPEPIKNIIKAEKNLPVITQLDDFENVIVKKPKKAPPVKEEEEFTLEEGLFTPPNDSRYQDLCQEIINLAQSIETETVNHLNESNLGTGEYEQLIELLEQTKFDLEGTFRIISG